MIAGLRLRMLHSNCVLLLHLLLLLVMLRLGLLSLVCGLSLC